MLVSRFSVLTMSISKREVFEAIFISDEWNLILHGEMFIPILVAYEQYVAKFIALTEMLGCTIFKNRYLDNHFNI